MIRRQFYHYTLWEDWRAGLYRMPRASEQGDAVYAASLLAMADDLRRAMYGVIDVWEVSSAVNLSHVARNRQAWLGQAACCYAVGVPELTTKFGWHLLTESLQAEANAVADEVIAAWEERQQATAWERYIGEAGVA
jgi:hypothetical protein